MDDLRLDIATAPLEACERLERELGLSPSVAQVLVRRGLADPAAAGAFLAADERHDIARWAGIDQAVALVLGHVERRSPIVVHGDYDCDGVAATAILVRVLRELGAEVGWYLPSRAEDGYGLASHTVERLASEGAGLLLTADCAITAIEEVELARGLGLDVVVTDHHRPRADGLLPDAALVHPGVCGAGFADLCAAAVAHKLAGALLAAGGLDPAGADEDLDLVALATVADCVPLQGENRRLVREGIAALRRTRRPGLRALLRVVRADPATVDETTIAFRLAPRINAAGRLHRADAGVELLLTGDPGRAEAIAAELDAANAERRHIETRILFEAEAQLAERGDRAAHVLAADGWHSGVIGIVASRLVERHNRPVVMVALDGERGTGSGRSIPAFDLLGGLDACSSLLVRHGGHRAAAGCTIERDRVSAFAEALAANAEAALRPDDLIRRARVDAVLGADEAGLDLAVELGRLAPFGVGNPAPALLVPAARLVGARPMGEGQHIRFTVESGGGRAAAVAFGRPRLPDGAEDGIDAVFSLEVNRWNGAESARLSLRGTAPRDPAAIELLGRPRDFLEAALAELDADDAHDVGVDSEQTCGAYAPQYASRSAARQPPRDRRGHGILATIVALVASGEPVVVATACEERRLRALEGRVGGFALCSWRALARDPAIATGAAHLVALDPPALADWRAALDELGDDVRAHLAWGEPELRFTEDVLAHDHASRTALAALYRELRDAPGAPLADVLRGQGRTAAHAGLLLRVLVDLGLVEIDRAGGAARLLDAPRADLGRSAAHRASLARLEEGRRWLSGTRLRAA